MKRLLAMALALALTLSLMLPVMASAEEEKVLNVFSWEGYIDYETVLGPFTAETGIKVNYIPFGSTDEMLTKLHATGGAEYDVILASDYVLDAARTLNLLQPLNKELIPNFKNLKAACLNQYFDPQSEYVVPYVLGTPTIVYDPAKVGFEITSYEDLWSPELKDSVVLIDDARNIIGITLKTLGGSLNSTEPELLAKAAEKLNGLRPNVRLFDYDTPHQQLISGECAVGYMFTPFAVMAHQERPDLKVVYPKEGVGFGIDGFVIPAKAAHPQNANLFLDFLLRPEIGAVIAEVQMYNNPNEASEPLLSEVFHTEPALNVPQDMLDKAEYIQFLGDDEAKFQEIWAAFKSK